MGTLDYLEEIHGSNPDSAIIWLHGLGADGYDFKPIVQQLNLPAEISIHFIFPHAPVRPVTINQGMSMNAWYDIYELSLEAEEDQLGIQNAVKDIETLIQDKFSHLDSKRVLLAGFSQGGAVVLHTLLHSSIDLGGAIALSTYLPLQKLASEGNKERIAKQEIFMAHGTEDKVLPHEIGKHAESILRTLGANVSWHSYPMAHQLCSQQILDIRNWITQRLK